MRLPRKWLENIPAAIFIQKLQTIISRCWQNSDRNGYLARCIEVNMQWHLYEIPCTESYPQCKFQPKGTDYNNWQETFSVRQSRFQACWKQKDWLSLNERKSTCDTIEQNRWGPSERNVYRKRESFVFIIIQSNTRHFATIKNLTFKLKTIKKFTRFEAAHGPRVTTKIRTINYMTD